GSNKDLVVRGTSAGDVDFLTAYSYSSVPPSLLTIPDGQTVNILTSDIADGNSMLWFCYETSGGTRGFVLAAVPPGPGGGGDRPASPATSALSLSVAEPKGVTVDYRAPPELAISP